MAFSHVNKKGVKYYLHSKAFTLKSGRVQTLFYFGKEAKANALDAVPQGYKVSETVNGLPVLKKV